MSNNTGSIILGSVGAVGLFSLLAMGSNTLENLDERIEVTERFACRSVESWVKENPEAEISIDTQIPFFYGQRPDGHILITDSFNQYGLQTVSYSIQYADGGEFDFANNLSIGAPC